MENLMKNTHAPFPGRPHSALFINIQLHVSKTNHMKVKQSRLFCVRNKRLEHVKC